MPVEPGPKKFTLGLEGMRKRAAARENQFAAPKKHRKKKRRYQPRPR